MGEGCPYKFDIEKSPIDGTLLMYPETIISAFPLFVKSKVADFESPTATLEKFKVVGLASSFLSAWTVMLTGIKRFEEAGSLLFTSITASYLPASIFPDLITSGTRVDFPAANSPLVMAECSHLGEVDTRIVE